MKTRYGRSGYMLFILSFLLLVSVTIAVSATSQRREEKESDFGMTDLSGDPAIGARLFKAKGCSTCHSIKGVGGDIGPDLGKMRHNHTNVRMAAIMWKHAPLMTKFMIEK